MVLSSILVLLLLLFRNRRSKHDENVDQLDNINCNRCTDDKSQRCAINNVTFETELKQEIIRVKREFEEKLLQVKSESEHNQRRAVKFEKEADLLKQEIKQMKKECEDKGHTKCDANKIEMIHLTGSSPSLCNEPLLPAPSFDIENPYFDICGIRISLRGNNHPDSVTVHHSLPSGLEHFENLRREGRDFDKTIKIGDVEINVHKALLGARIPFFMNLFGENWIESSCEVISLPKYDSNVIDCIVNYAYSGILTITEHTVQDLMRTASFLCMEEVVEDCYQFMKKRIEFDDALPLLFFCRAIHYNKTDEYLMKFIASNFVPISKTPEFLDLTVGDILNLIQRDALNIDDEKQVFDAVDRWIGKDDSRKTFGPGLFELIPCPCLSPSFLTETVLKKDWIKNSPRCVDTINEALGNGKNSLISLKSARRNSHVHNLIVITNSNRFDFHKHNNEFSKLEIFDPLTNEWHHGIIECRKLHENAVVVGDEIIFLGYTYDDETRKTEGTMIYLNTRTSQWHTLSMPSLEDRSNSVYGVINGKIYSAGGEDDYMDHFITFDPSNPSAGWTKLVNMAQCRDGAASCVLDGKFYVIGGYKNTSRDGEYYDPATNEWTPIAAMKNSSHHDGAAALNGCIYLVGTVYHGKNNITGSLQKYSPATNEWTELKNLKHPRSSPCVVASGGKLYVCGGWNRGYSKQVPYMEMYDPETDTWEELQMPELPNRPVMFSIAIPASFPTPNVEL